MKRIHDKNGSADPVAEPNPLATRSSSNPFVVASSPPLRRMIRRQELHRMVPLADTTIYDMERRGEFPRRFKEALIKSTNDLSHTLTLR